MLQGHLNFSVRKVGIVLKILVVLNTDRQFPVELWVHFLWLGVQSLAVKQHRQLWGPLGTQHRFEERPGKGGLSICGSPCKEESILVTFRRGCVNVLWLLLFQECLNVLLNLLCSCFHPAGSHI